MIRTAEDKFEALEKAGVTTVRSPLVLGDATQEALMKSESGAPFIVVPVEAGTSRGLRQVAK